MRQALARPGLRASVLTIGLLAACSDQPTPSAPSSPPPTPPAGTSGPATPTLTISSLRIDGPNAVPPGGSATYTATARWSDGSSRDVTAEARWSSTDESVLSVKAPGVTAGVDMGEAEVRATLEGYPWEVGRHVYVVPEGRFIVSVNVSDGLIPVAPLFDARVEVVSGSAAGVSGVTDWNGNAKLVGVPSVVEFRITKDGYQPLVRSTQIGFNGLALRVGLIPAVARPELTGLYRLTVSSGVCDSGGSLPDAATTRTYTAGIHEPGGKVRVLLRDGAFVLRRCCFGGDGNAFDGQTQALDTRFELLEYRPPWDWNDGSHPSVAERLADGTVLTVSGRALVKPSPEGFEGTLDGAITIFDAIPLDEGAGRVLATCRSRAHRFTLAR